jgi:hypothetical protein
MKLEQPICITNIVYISDKDRMQMFYLLLKLKNDPSYEFIGEVILKINIV